LRHARVAGGRTHGDIICELKIEAAETMNKARPLERWLSPLAAVLLLTIAIAVSTSAVRDRGLSPTEGGPKSATPPTPLIEAKPTPAAAIASAADDIELANLIEKAIDASDFAAARWGVCVLSISDGRVLYARDADKLFTPASNMKIYTTAVALDLLGANYRWRTSVLAGSQPDASGAINGDLTLYGRGAPDLMSRPKKEEPASLVQLANNLYQRGVRHIHGNVVGDESYFRGEPLGDGWQWNDIQWYFGAEPSALSIDGNEVDVEIRPPTNSNQAPAARLSNAQGYIHLTNDIATVKSGEQLTVGIHRGLSDNEVRVWGEFPSGSRGFGARLSIHDPARLAATLFIATLKTCGITVDGDVRTRDFRVPQKERFDPSKAIELTYVDSGSLAEIVRATNKESINLNAELILRTLGRERGETAPDVDPHKTHERGDDEAGLAVIRQWLSRASIATNILALHDGSGLSRLDLITPETTARLLQAISKTPAGSVFRASLPLAGTDGTLKGRLRNYKDRISAKTGSLTYDNSLSGFLTTVDGAELAFSIMCNDQTGRASSIRLIDQITGILVDHSLNKTRKPPKT
jgi:D-alanyl-D-alanine carboxypeptidase/D-alanyl-D-alanine-endopeptidase (penicillin-binding protein 4)